MIKHIKKWLRWRKRSADSIPVKIAVLFGMKVPSFEFMLTDDEEREIGKAFRAAFEAGCGVEDYLKSLNEVSEG